MATVKLKFRKSSVEGKEGTLYYQVTHRGRASLYTTGYRLFPHEWDAGRACVVWSAADAARRRYLMEVEQHVYTQGLDRLHAIVRQLEQRGAAYTAGRVMKLFRQSGKQSVPFCAFARQAIRQWQAMGRLRGAETFASALRSFMRFRGAAGDVAIDEIDSDMIRAYGRYLEARHLCPNTISFYMRNLRSLYNQAVEQGLAEQNQPFRRVYTGVAKTVKRAVPPDVVNAIKTLDLSAEPTTEFARDLFLFSFYTRGMSFIDMAFLRKTDLNNGVLAYHRHKTGRRLRIRWEQPMQTIVDKYGDPLSPYLLPVIVQPGTNERRQYLTAGHLLNRKLKHIGRMLDRPVNLTFYVARHSWASIAKSKDIAVSVISEAMGHDSESTTRIYLSTLDTSLVDSANRVVMDAVLS